MPDFITKDRSSQEQLAQRMRDDIAQRIDALRRMEKSLEPIDASDVRGSEAAKRALTIAIAGDHSILFIGEPDSAKSMLRRVGASLEHYQSFESRPCPCGWRGSIAHECTCDIQAVEQHTARLQNVDIVIQTCPPTARELNSRLLGTGTARIKTDIDAAKVRAADPLFESKTLGGQMQGILDQAKSEMGISAGQLDRVLAVARTIATFERFETIHASHLFEAINYQLRYQIHV